MKMQIGQIGEEVGFRVRRLGTCCMDYVDKVEIVPRAALLGGICKAGNQD